MIPQIASALARILNPIKAIQRPGESPRTEKSADGGEGGHGALSYDGRSTHKKPTPQEEPQKESQLKESSSEKIFDPLDHQGDAQKKSNTVPFQPGLTQVILDLSQSRTSPSGGTAAQTYENGAKEQKKNAKLPKGSMLDKKVG